MAKRKKDDGHQGLLPVINGPATTRRRQRWIILPRFLTEEAQKAIYQGPAQDRAREILLKWADLDSHGDLIARKETSLDAEFLREVFADALGYRMQTDRPAEWSLERQYTVPDVGTADGAIGLFTPGGGGPRAIIELKDANTDLDGDRFNGRTPVQQCWDYLNALPGCSWGIVSNFITIRLYYREKGSQAYEEFSLQELRDIRRFREFYCLFEHGGLLKSLERPPRAEQLLRQTGERLREVGDELYGKYSESRLALLWHLHRKLGKSLDRAISIAQKLIDRIVFIAFCEGRGLLAGKTIEKTYHAVPPFAKATNPRWRNFLDLFHAMDRGHPELDIPTGYDGGLFAHDEEVDNLQLGDEWTEFFREVGTYDFSQEVNVDVLGHLFERSVTDIERLRRGGLFAGAGEGEAPSRMPKSAQRKRMGIYYTPPEFTGFIVRETVDEVVRERFEELAGRHGVNPDAGAAGQDAAKLEAYWRACLAVLGNLKVCDPACGSGAFLIRAYDALEDHYHTVVRGLAAHAPAEAERIDANIPDLIVRDNLFGVDLSIEAVEITQLALWIRSARRGRTLADLSKNILVGNSLVADQAVDPHALDWKAAFPEVFSRAEGGFDCVVGNPPWERLKLQEREFFSFSAPEIAEAVSAAERRKLIAKLEKGNPELFALYTQAGQAAERVLDYARSSGRFPLTGKGDVNTYMLFAELARSLVAPRGRVGLLVPSGIATDDTTKDFFAELVDSKALIKLYDFENRLRVFPDVDGRFKFSTLVFGGRSIKTKTPDYFFFAHSMDDLADRKRHIVLSADDIALLNPNTRTCPIFRSKRDAELTRAIYQRVPVLVEHSRGERGNPWGVRFLRMFDQTNDAELFHTAEQLTEMGFKPRGNRWAKGKQTFLPLYEAKMVQMYDHRAAGVIVNRENWMRQGQTEETSLVSRQKPEFTATPRWWAGADKVKAAFGEDERPAYLGYKDVTSPTNTRTMIAAFLPLAGVVNSAPLVLPKTDLSPRRVCCLLANLNAFVLDYVARQKVGGVHLNFFIVEQLPMFPPDEYERKCPWNERQTLERWISERVLKLTCTADDMRPLAEACGFKEGVHKWHPDERARLMAELDAAYFILYGIARDDAEYILSTFAGAGRGDAESLGTPAAAQLILAAYDELAAAVGG